jgi:FlaA1/EpsC-like NDP-sugar epimerase
MKKILITGGSGFLGSHIVKYYLDKGWIVYSLARNEFRQWQLKQRFPKVNIILGDIRYFDGKLEPDVIIHTSAMKHILFCEENTEEACDINVNGTNNMIEWAHENKVKDFILISSDKAIEPTTLYGTTKAQAEKITRESGYRIARFGNFFGSTGSVMQIWLENLIQGKNEVQIHNKDCRRYFVEVLDACERINQFLESDKKIMIYAGAIGWMNDLACAIFGDDVKIEYTKLLKGEKLIEKMDTDLDEKDFMRYSIEELRDMFRTWAAQEMSILIGE